MPVFVNLDFFFIEKKRDTLFKGVNLVAKSIFDQFRRGQPRRQPRGQPKRQKSWRFGVSQSGGFSEILLKKMVVGRLETSDSTTTARRVFLPQFNRAFAVSGAQNVRENSIFVRKDATSKLDFEAENLRFRCKMWSNETALKQRKKAIFEPLGRAPVTEIRRNRRRIWPFRHVSTAILL